ncbi:YczE/YyaS/YitT family protein [Anaerobacillus sp. MEB173]|uniref:YczE/YyaS/YitT family protein n=1 Tax=Anaerobacillus sp. MEB173 TaxID=3383345 RepID=UPI003F90AAF1
MRSLLVNLLWFVCSITLNALGNSYMIIANLGSAPWAAAGENLASILPFSIGVCIIILNFCSFILSYLMKIKFTLTMIIKSITLTFVFGLFIDLFLYLHHIMYVPENIWIRCLYLLIGLNLMAVAISIYFQSSSVYLPSDYLLKAFGKRLNNYTLGTILCTLIPLSISLVIMIFQHHITGVGIGTMLFMFGIGFFIDQYNRWIVIHKVPKQNTYSA